MDIRVGLSTNDLVGRLHRLVSLRSAARLDLKLKLAKGQESFSLPGDTELKILPENSQLNVVGLALPAAAAIRISPANTSEFTITSLSRAGVHPKYQGCLELLAVAGQIRVILIADLDTYVKGVLRSEMPDNYCLPALMAQAVAARTYGLRPRLSHESEGFDVCDSYLHCQAFSGTTFSITNNEQEAIDRTSGQILTYDGQPLLALFSSNAGGHTENYENCFSDPISNEFPPAPLPYLKGVAEGVLPASLLTEKGLRLLWGQDHPDTADAWSNRFRWRWTLTEKDYEGHMHHVVQDMLEDPQFRPFICPPSGGQFGHINGFTIGQRGVSGVAISLTVHTSAGDWIIRKELTIRSIFKSPESKLIRLPSARFFLEPGRDKLGLLSQLTIKGLGFGHGVGLQQTGAQGWARRGKDYRQILAHYYPGAKIALWR